MTIESAEVNWFAGRRVVIATRHRKETVIADLLKSELGLEPFVIDDFDTDRFGTFSGEVERLFDPVTTLRMKCVAAMDLADCDIAIASEGSFGPHPSMWMLPADEEWIMLFDRKNNLEVIERELSTETNYRSATVTGIEELEKFAVQSCFPSHGLILRELPDAGERLEKGITTRERLRDAFRELANPEGRIQVETDMRAIYNPTRMKIIQTVAQKLVSRIKTLCPKCMTPGFGITGTISGRRCRQCKSPTSSLLAYEHSCARCGYKEQHSASVDQWEDPMYCDVCNP